MEKKENIINDNISENKAARIGLPQNQPSKSSLGGEGFPEGQPSRGSLGRAEFPNSQPSRSSQRRGSGIKGHFSGIKYTGHKRQKETYFLEEIPIDPIQKQQVLGKIAEAVERKRYLYCPSALEIFRRQLKYISGFCLGGQMACMACLLALFWHFQVQGREILSYLGAGSAGAAYLGVFLMLELSRSREFGMAELEQSCYLNIRQVWCVKMICFGCLDILALTSMVAVIAGNTSYGILRVLVYLLVPFVLSNGLQLLAFTMFRSRKRGYLQLAVALLASGSSLLPLRYPVWYGASYLGIWVCILAAAIVFVGKEMARAYQKLEEGETICWN